MVGVAGFEPTTSCSQSRRDTGLRYTPKNWYHLNFPDPTDLSDLVCDKGKETDDIFIVSGH